MSGDEFLDMAGQQGRAVTCSKQFMQHLAGSGSESCQCETAAAGVLLGEAPLSHVDRLHIYRLYRQGMRLLGAFVKLRKTTISFLMSVRLSGRMEQLVSHWTDFH